MNIYEYEGTYNVGDKLNCILPNGEIDYAKKEIHSNYTIVGNNIKSGDNFTRW